MPTHSREFAWFAVFAACAAISLVILVAIFAFLLREGGPLLLRAGVGSFFSGEGWAPLQGRFDLSAMAAGSLAVTSLALALSVPLGLATAAYLVLYAASPARRVADMLLWLMAGVPSVVYGYWGLTAVVPWVRELRAPGVSVLAGGIVLALMILPTFTLVAVAALEMAPRDRRDAADALGLSRWTYFTRILAPSARGGLLAGLLLQLGRALGETMAVIMVMGNTPRIPRSFFDPARTLTAHIAVEMGYAMHDHRRALFADGLILLVLVTGVVLLADRIARPPERA